MKILFFKSNIFMQEDWFETLQDAGHEVHPVTYVFTDYFNDDFFAGKFRRRLQKISYDAVFSYNFYPVISDICNECGTPYISWIYDSPIPHFARFDTPYNHVYHFDKTETEEYIKKGYRLIKHLPLAVNTNRLDRQLGIFNDIPEYIHDISFVGNLYDKRSLQNRGLISSEYILGVLEGYAAAQTQFFNTDITKDLLHRTRYLNTDQFTKDFPWKFFFRSIHEEATHQERSHLLRKLSEHFSVDLYTADSLEDTDRLRVHPPIGYYTEMPNIFRGSRINLNINYRTIRSGISARIFDIMGCGGFVMTTPQPELFDFFIEDTDFVTFHSLEELIDKCAYYLTHEDERHQIALNAYHKVKEFHTYESRFPVLFASL